MNAFVAAALLSATAPADKPAPERDVVQAPKAVKWEYAVLTLGPAAGGGRGNPGGGRGNPAGGNQAFQAQPAQPAQPAPAMARYTWTTPTEDVAADSLKELAEKLKVEVKDKEAPARVVRTAVLNALGAQGWELVGQGGTTGQTYTFKRRVP